LTVKDSYLNKFVAGITQLRLPQSHSWIFRLSFAAILSACSKVRGKSFHIWCWNKEEYMERQQIPVIFQ